MSTNIADVVVHIDETLPLDELKTIENHIHKIGGVVSACNRDDEPHLISVTYNPEQVKSHDILVKIKSEGVHAELVGL
jgi:sensor histidine kinase regulating citrate/malate metabolism